MIGAGLWIAQALTGGVLIGLGIAWPNDEVIMWGTLIGLGALTVGLALGNLVSDLQDRWERDR
jgi:hypothetical protein